MEEITFSIWKDQYETMTRQVRVGCRGIIRSEDLILLSYESKKDLYFIPGGGLEEGETTEEGCSREVEEETGFLVIPEKLLAVVDGYYRDRIFRNYFYSCRLTGTSIQHLTQEEAGNGMEPRWVPLSEAVRIFGTYKDYEYKNEMLCESYLRDYRILTEILTDRQL